MNTVTANELKVRGISVLKEVTADTKEAVITVRGKSKYVVLPIEEYNYLRECELESALAQSLKDVEKGNFKTGTVEEHIKRITDA